MTLTKDLIGKLVTIQFLDHTAYTKEPCICRVAGWVTNIEEKHVVLAWWDLMFDDEEDTENNREHCSIILSTILEVKSY